jgi:catechol 2,3-dioxygenase-like lactoylglutathione lyase family enzyme
MNDPKTKLILVHKEGEEGSIQIDAQTGGIVTEIDQRPDWAEGLSVALLAERNKFYRDRLGSKYAAEHASPEAMSYEDLGWVGADAEGELLEIEASAEHRQGVLSEVLGWDEETATFKDKAGFQTVAEVEIAMDTARTTAEATEIAEEFKRDTFGTDAEAERKATTG